MNSTTYAVIEDGPGVSIHSAHEMAGDFPSVEDAHEYIAFCHLRRVQIVAVEHCKRRWLNDLEQLRLNRAIVNERSAA